MARERAFDQDADIRFRLKHDVLVFNHPFREASVQMIEQHYGHVNTVKHADRVLQGMTGCELPHPDDTKANASKAAETHDKLERIYMLRFNADVQNKP